MHIPFNFQRSRSLARPFCALILSILAASLVAHAQDPWKNLEKRPATLGLEKGYINLNAPGFRFKLVKASQTLASLQPASEKDFDYTPADRLKVRSSNGMYQLGDLNLRLKTAGDTAWTAYSTAANRAAIKALPTADSLLAAADLSASLPAHIPLKIQRQWKLVNGSLALVFVLKNTGIKTVEIGSLGMPMIFNNVLQGKSLEEAHAQNVFYDPYIGRDAGYLQVTRLSGQGPVLLVTPYGKSPLEAYNPLLDDPSPKGIDFEGFYEWMVYSKAYSEKEWKKAEPWNKPTSGSIKPGETKTFGVQFSLAASIRGIEQQLAVQKRPVAIGIPGYVLPQDVDGKLFLKYPKSVKSIQVEPAGALRVIPIASENKSLNAYQVKGLQWGRARLTLTYADGLEQTISYKVIKPEKEVLKDYGSFLTHQQWYENKADPFGRDQSVITYDDEKKQQVTQDSRVWIAGLSDEGGAGSWLGAMMKQFAQPDVAEVARLQHFTDHTLFGNIQHSSGPQKYGVKKSVFYYQPDSLAKGTYSDSLNWKTWAAWNHKDANDVGRSYNYPHVTAAHWVMYRLARNHPGMVKGQTWNFYLNNAYETAMAMVKQAPYYAQFGQMEGTIFVLLLMDMKAEGWNEQAALLEKEMKARADHWRTLQYPFGSEMPWDSTGQEEVYAWSRYFGYTDKASVTINAILGYMPTLPHWGYNGSARRYWDFLYGGKLSRIERQLHHYGSGLNAIPVLSEYRAHPDDLYLLRVGYGGLMGSIANITKDGFGPAAFHSFPSTLQIDGLSGDYGPNFFGYAVNAATYITQDKELGWLAFGGNLTHTGDLVKVAVTNGEQSRVFLAPIGLWLTLDAGTFKTVIYDTVTGKVSLTLNAADAFTPKAYLRIQQKTAGAYHLKNAESARGAYVITLHQQALELVLEK